MLVKLHLMQFVVEALKGDQFVVRTHFFYLAFIQHNDLACLADGRQPVGNDYGGATGNQFIDRFLNK